MNNDNIKAAADEHVECPRCNDRWYDDLDEQGLPYTCYYCCNGTIKLTKPEPPPPPSRRWIMPK